MRSTSLLLLLGSGIAIAAAVSVAGISILKFCKKKKKRCACLIVIDGWGIKSDDAAPGDAIANSLTPFMDDISDRGSCVNLEASGLAVGLPDKLMGNSEVGHLNIGAGRVVYQDIVRIELAIKNDELLTNSNYLTALHRVKTTSNGRLILLGLVSDGGVHSHIRHLFALISTAKKSGYVKKVFIHVFTDGRDTAPKSAVEYINQLQSFIDSESDSSFSIKIATLMGRYYAMDRDKRFERTAFAFAAINNGHGDKINSSHDLVSTLQSKYQGGETDEFFKPVIVDTDGCLKEGDTLLFFNYRSDRMRQLVKAIGISRKFPSATPPSNLHITTMTQYKAKFAFPVLFPQKRLDNVLAEWLSKQNAHQMHIAETEKYAHVTFFFNGGREAAFPNEDRKLVASPKVATYDLKPEMSCVEVAKEVCRAVESNNFDFVMCNLAPPDMVGHTGNYDATLKAVAATDSAIGLIYNACLRSHSTLFVTSDHGNAEKMISANGEPHTAHTTSLVPFLMIEETPVCSSRRKLSNDSTEVPPALCDVAPTILDYLGFEKPLEMTGKSLLNPK